MKQSIKGKFTPRHPEKYIGNVNKIRYLSSWELDFMRFADNNPNVLKWGSECIAIPYVKPTDKKVHRYYPDIYMEYKNRKGEIIKEIIEIKPLDQTQPPKTKGKRRDAQLYEAVRWAVNVEKWKACQDFCNKANIKFRIMTENQLFRN